VDVEKEIKLADLRRTNFFDEIKNQEGWLGTLRNEMLSGEWCLRHPVALPQRNFPPVVSPIGT